MLEQGCKPWSFTDEGQGSKITLQGDQRSYLTTGRPRTRWWKDVRYDKLRLLGKTLHVTIDVAEVGCGCNAALYLVDMAQPDAGGNSN